MSHPREYPAELLDRGARLVFESNRPIAHVGQYPGCVVSLRRSDRGGRS